MKTELETQAVKKLAIFLSLGAVLWLALKFVWAFAEDILLADMRFNAAFGSTLYSTDLYSMDYWLLKEGWNVLTAFLRMAFVSFWLCWGVVRAMTACVSVSVGSAVRQQRTKAALRKAALFSVLLGGFAAAARLAQVFWQLLDHWTLFSVGLAMLSLDFQMPLYLLLQLLLCGGIYVLSRVPFLLLIPVRLRDNLSESLRCTMTDGYARAFWKAAWVPCAAWVATLLLPVVFSTFLSLLLENPAAEWMIVLLYQGLLPVLTLLLLSVTGSLPRAILRLSRLPEKALDKPENTA